MMFFDRYQLVVHHDGDSGDSCADTFRYWYARRLGGSRNIAAPKQAYQTLFRGGIGIRSPYQWNDPADFSRDQTRPAVICLQAFGCIDELAEIKKEMIARGWKYQNGEIAWPDHRAEFDPAGRRFWADLSQVIASIFLVLHSWINWKMCDDDQNHIAALIQFHIAKPTALNWIARRIYSWRRRGPIWALETFYAIDNPEIGALMEAPVRTLILGEPPSPDSN